MKIKNPLQSQTASGHLKNRLVFSLRKTGQQARFQKKQKDASTKRQENQRKKYRTAVNNWIIKNEEEKAVYKKMAVKKNMTGYNLFIKLNITEPLTENPAIFGLAIFGKTKYARKS